MAAQLPRNLLDRCPEPGHPPGCDSHLDHRIWLGWRDRREIPVREVRIWGSPEKKRAGAKPILLRADYSMPGWEWLAIKAASKGASSGLLEEIRAVSEEMSVEQQVAAMAKQGLVVEVSAPTTYTKKTAGPALYRVVMQAAWYLASLVWDLDANRPRVFERPGPNDCYINVPDQRGRLARLDLETVLRECKDNERRIVWVRELSDDDRKAMTLEIIRRAIRMITEPPEWSKWAGTIRQCRYFVRRDDYTSTRVPKAVVGWKRGTLRRSALAELARRWITPDGPIARATNTVECGQLSLLRQGLL